MATYLVTGATRGIGLELARQLSARGEEVIATARNPARPGELEALPVRVVGLDLHDPWSIEGLAEITQGVDVLINNAGVSSQGTSVTNLEKADLEQAFLINSIAPMLVAKALLPALRSGQRRQIINISSQLASVSRNTGGSSYGYRASKAALNMLTVCLSNELKAEGFTCVAMHPGWVRTDMGGSGAPLTPAQSVRSLLEVFDALTPQRTGSFLNYDGTTIPW